MAIQNDATDLKIKSTTISVAAGLYIRQEIAIFGAGGSVKMVNVVYQNKQSYTDGDLPITVDGIPDSFDVDISLLSTPAQQALNDALYYTQEEVISKLETLNPTWVGKLTLVDVTTP